METRVRRYFTFKKLTSKLPQSSHAANDLDLIGIPYEHTSSGQPPVVNSEARTQESAKVRDATNVLAVRSFPYAAAVAGTAPVIGARPIKGNGPVKLQTSRRLSSGELLVTTQDHQRTLSDIRDGGYIVGRKEPKRISKITPATRPICSRSSSPRTSFGGSPPQLSHSPAPSPNIERRTEKKRIPEPIIIDQKADRSEILASATRPHGPNHGGESMSKAYILGPAEIPLPLSPGKTPSSRTSLLSRGEEQNATIQALWKAEYARLVAIYGQDGVDRNIAELNKDRLGTLLEKRQSLDTFAGGLNVSSLGLQPPAVAAIVPPPVRSPRGSLANFLPPADTGSDDSSVKVPSLLSSEESSSSYTKRTSIFEADIPTTREEVSRMVEDMRKNYLKALEAKAAEKPKTKRPKKPRQRASYAHSTATMAPAGPKSSKAGRQSWHASTRTTTPKQEKQSRKQSGHGPRTPRVSTISPLISTVSKSSLEGKPQLHRADSTTLGSFFGSKNAEQISQPPPTKLDADTPAKRSSRMEKVHSALPASNKSASSMSSSDDMLPEIDDFDIFYQDLTQGFGSSPGQVEATDPTACVPVSPEGISVESEDTAPPPPNIDWTPRKRGAALAL